MSEEIVITYKTETLQKENFTERESAIFSAGYKEGTDFKNIVKFMLVFILIMISLPLIAYLLKINV